MNNNIEPRSLFGAFVAVLFVGFMSFAAGINSTHGWYMEMSMKLTIAFLFALFAWVLLKESLKQIADKFEAARRDLNSKVTALETLVVKATDSMKEAATSNRAKLDEERNTVAKAAHEASMIAGANYAGHQRNPETQNMDLAAPAPGYNTSDIDSREAYNTEILEHIARDISSRTDGRLHEEDFLELEDKFNSESRDFVRAWVDPIGKFNAAFSPVPFPPRKAQPADTTVETKTSAPKPLTLAQQRKANDAKGLGKLTNEEVRTARAEKRKAARAAKIAKATETTTTTVA